MASLADRITKPEGDQGSGDATQQSSNTPTTMTTPPPADTTQATSSSWADEAEDEATDASAAPTEVKVKAEKDTSSLSGAQTDGAGEEMGGEQGIIEPSYAVDLKLADLQADPNDPLYSVKSFEQLGL